MYWQAPGWVSLILFDTGFNQRNLVDSFISKVQGEMAIYISTLVPFLLCSLEHWICFSSSCTRFCGPLCIWCCIFRIHYYYLNKWLAATYSTYAEGPEVLETGWPHGKMGTWVIEGILSGLWLCLLADAWLKLIRQQQIRLTKKR